MENNTSREYTREEIREMFLKHIRRVAKYWSEQDGDKERCCHGAVFSVLTLLDGCTALPRFSVVPSPHPKDKDYHLNKGENYFPESRHLEFCDIGGCLHDEFYE
jgi:hypothetical protein